MKAHNTPPKCSTLIVAMTAVVLSIVSLPSLAVSTHHSIRTVPDRWSAHPVTKHVVLNAVSPDAVSNARPPAKPKRPDPRQLLAASLRGDLRTVQQLVKQRVNIHYANSDRETALHMAASRGHLAVVIFLIQSGANMNARTVGNWIPLHHAVRFNRQNVANYLMAKGAPAYYKTSDGLSSLDIAKAVRNQRLISLVQRYMK